LAQAWLNEQSLTPVGPTTSWLDAMMRVLAALPLLCSVGHALKAELTDKDYKSKTEGKNALLFFQAPW